MWPIRTARGLAACLGRGLAAGLLGLCWTAAEAVVISPVLVEISPTRRVASITVSNSDDSPISFQTQVLSWQQVEGVDQYAQTRQLVVVPPIAEIAAGGSQIFRVTTRLPPGPQETAFRLILEDVTQLATPATGADAMQVVLRVNHNLPVFFAAAETTPSTPRISVCPKAQVTGRRCVRIENVGNRYLAVKSLTLASGPWHQDLRVSGRVLAGAWKQWEFDLPDHLDGDLEVSAQTSSGLISATLPAH